MAEFNLIDEEWIPCVLISETDKSNGNVVNNFGLKKALTEAHEMSEVIGENPLITVSIYRLLLAILHDVFQGPKDVDEWGNLWQKGSFEKQVIKNYFQDNFDNFFLFHNERPFYQKAEFSHKSKDKPIWKIFLEGEKYSTIFEHTCEEKPIRLTPAIAAKYLIAFQNFDVAGFKDLVEEGMTRTEVNQVKSADSCLLNKCAVGLVKGKNLFESLMLNLTQCNRTFGIPFPKREIKRDLPTWKNNGHIDPKKDSVLTGYLDLLTWQNRQIKLKLSQKKTVDRIAVIKGNQISDLGYLQGKEQMVAFRKDKSQGWLPIGFSKERAIWRDIYSLFHSIEGVSSRPETLNWLNDLVANGKLAADSVFPLDFFGMGSNKAKPLFWRHERLPMPVKYLSDFELCNELKEALKFAESTAFLLNDSIYKVATLFYLPDSRFEIENWYKPFHSKKAVNNFEEYKKRKDTKDKFKVSKGKPVGEIPLLAKSLAPGLRYWSRLENPFRRHLLELTKGKPVWKDKRENWANEILKSTVFLAFEEAVQNLGSSPNALRAVSISQSWLEAEFNNRKKKFLNFEILENEEQITNEDEEEDEE